VFSTFEISTDMVLRQTSGVTMQLWSLCRELVFQTHCPDHIIIISGAVYGNRHLLRVPFWHDCLGAMFAHWLLWLHPTRLFKNSIIFSVRGFYKNALPLSSKTKPSAFSMFPEIDPVMGRHRSE